MQKNTATTFDPPRSLKAEAAAGNHIIASAGKNQHKIESLTQHGAKMTALATVNKQEVSFQQQFSPKQIDILKSSICKGVSNEEFEVFLMACQKTQLDPFMRQIYAVKRKSKRPDGTWGETMTIQTGIDGYRLIAERTERYAPGEEPTYKFDPEGRLQSATAYIKKQTKDGTWHTVSASAYIDEYCQKTRDGLPMGMWSNMPKTMLAKCAEAQALRKAFPAEMSGVYTKEEMEQADFQDITPKITPAQAKDLEMTLEECDEKYRNWVYDFLSQKHGVNSFSELPLELYTRIKTAALKNVEEQHAKQKQQIQETQFVEVQ